MSENSFVVSVPRAGRVRAGQKLCRHCEYPKHGARSCRKETGRVIAKARQRLKQSPEKAIAEIASPCGLAMTGQFLGRYVMQ